MKILFLILFPIFSFASTIHCPPGQQPVTWGPQQGMCVTSQAPVVCPPGQIRYYMSQIGAYCAPAYSWNQDYCIACQQQQQAQYQAYLMYSQQNTFLPFQGWNQMNQPWWAYQGQMYYPNTYYPGAWNYPGMNSYHYPGQGGAFAAKPNVYVKTVLPQFKFKLQFDFKSDEHQLLVTTPFVNKEKSLSWSGEVSKDHFVFDYVNYDYLFYDVRFDHKKLQYEYGYCADRETLIENMIEELGVLKFSKIAIQDFEEHWKVKIPQYATYCVYPQYNEQLDQAIPLKVEGPKNYWTRVLFVLVPHDTKELTHSDKVYPPFPQKDHEAIRPDVRVEREVMFQEWGVAFLASEVIKNK